jgi:hypothetical protein
VDLFIFLFFSFFLASFVFFSPFTITCHPFQL